jgi:adenylate kinase family enzyme
MRAYREQTAPVIEWYRARAGKGDSARLLTIDAVGDIDAVTRRVLDVLSR